VSRLLHLERILSGLRPDAILSSRMDQFQGGRPVDPTYVFAGNSDAIVNGSTSLVSTVTNANDTYDGADFTANSLNVAITSTTALLVRLDVSASAGAMPGDYSLRLINATSTFFKETNQGPTLLSFISNPGTVTVGGTVVPEQSSVVLLVGTALCGLAVTSRRIRRVYLDSARTSIRSLVAAGKWLAGIACVFGLTSSASAAVIIATGQNNGDPSHSSGNYFYAIDTATGLATPISPAIVGGTPAGLAGAPNGTLMVGC